MINQIKRFFKEEEGLATIEIVLILVVLAGVAFLFRDMLFGFFEKIKLAIEEQLNGAIAPPTAP